MPTLPELNQEELQPAVYKALDTWSKLDSSNADFLAHLLLVQEQRLALPDSHPTTFRLATNRVLLSAIDELAKQDPQGSRILKLRFPDDNKTLSVANQVGLSVDQVKRRQREAIWQLTQIILKNELAARESRIQSIEVTLESPSYTTLFGVDKSRQTLVEQLLDPHDSGVIVLVGIGGIGKTALADAIVREVIRHFYYERILWLRVNSPQTFSKANTPEKTLDNLITQLGHRLLPQMPVDILPEQYKLRVRQLLKADPHLVVIDNLEDEADTTYLLENLHDLAQPSKFLLTTRIHSHSRPGTFAFYLKELSLDTAIQLIRHHAQTTGLYDLATSTDEQIGSIYSAVGGNPQALKLIVGLAYTFPLNHILLDLKEARFKEIEEMYRHIYWQAWHSLQPESQGLLEKMTLIDDIGALPEQMARLSGLDETNLWKVIGELTHRSLVEVRGTSWERRYGIHQLTRSFLLSEVAHWPEQT